MNNFADVTLEEYKTNYLLSEWNEFNFRQSYVNRKNYQWIIPGQKLVPDCRHTFYPKTSFVQLD